MLNSNSKRNVRPTTRRLTLRRLRNGELAMHLWILIKNTRALEVGRSVVVFLTWPHRIVLFFELHL